MFVNFIQGFARCKEAGGGSLLGCSAGLANEATKKYIVGAERMLLVLP
jgi:hypothetical protein